MWFFVTLIWVAWPTAVVLEDSRCLAILSRVRCTNPSVLMVILDLGGDGHFTLTAFVSGCLIHFAPALGAELCNGFHSPLSLSLALSLSAEPGASVVFHVWCSDVWGPHVCMPLSFFALEKTIMLSIFFFFYTPPATFPQCTYTQQPLQAKCHDHVTKCRRKKNNQSITMYQTGVKIALRNIPFLCLCSCGEIKRLYMHLMLRVCWI